ncbi:MAG: hypothetical protein K9L74_06245 [Candidatus Izimaplasma sp.]|nr:hypothetical protein [Candidatus Izimaplasma bacterium]
MKPKIRKVLRYDYLSSMMFILFIFSTIIFAAAIFIEPAILTVAIILEVGITLLMFLRVRHVRKSIAEARENIITGDIKIMHSQRGNLRYNVKYTYQGKDYNKNYYLLAGPFLRGKIDEMTEDNLIVNPNHPERAYIKDLYIG